MLRAPAAKISVILTCAASLLAFAALALADPAHAQQTFLCEDGGSVTVLPGQLELMKRTDPCVARHFQDSPVPGAGVGPGAVVGPGQWQEQGQEPASQWEAATEEPPPGSAPMEAPLPARKPETLMAAAEGAGGAAGGQKEPPAEVKSDYRHVHIINAGRGAPQFYEHTR